MNRHNLIINSSYMSVYINGQNYQEKIFIYSEIELDNRGPYG